MAKQIVITYKGNDYTLEFNRKTVRRMEESGFVVDTNKPATMITELFRGAFQMHHKRIDREFVRKLWDKQRNKEGLLTALVKAYQKPLEDLMAEPEGDADEENPTWKET